jgi:putative PIN family toxin of toxin-antitoxin system
MIRAVFDTVVFVRSLINPHSIWGRLLFELIDAYELSVSPPLLQEILEVVDRPRLKQKYRTTTERGLRQLLEIVSRADVVELGEIAAVSRDPKDNKVLATAKAAGVEYIVSEDEDFLTITTYEGIKIVPTATFLRVLERGSGRKSL